MLKLAGMRALGLVVSLLATTSSATSGHVIVNTEDHPASKLQQLLPKTRVRLTEIDIELHGLTHRPSGGAVFVQTLNQLYPWFLGGAVPLMAVGTVLGFTKVTSVNGDQGITVAALAAAGTFFIVGALLLVVCAFRMIDHWISEADGARARAGRIRQLRTERQELVLRN